MKRVFALITVLSICLSVFAVTPASAASAFAKVDVSDSDTTYNPGSTIDISIKLSDITLETGDGVSIFAFFLYYDVEKVVPLVSASADSDGDNCNFFELVTSAPLNWDSIGKLDTEHGYYELAFCDYSGTSLAVNNNTIALNIPFAVKEETKVDDLVFNMNSIEVYNSDLTKSCTPADFDIVVSYAMQPEELVTLPEDAIGIDVAGFKDGENVVYYASEQTTVADYISQSRNDSDMSDYGIIIVDENGVVTYVDVSDSDKSSAVIPAGSYLIGVSSGNTSDHEAFSESAQVGANVSVYNLNIEAAGKGNVATELESVGFTIIDPSLRIKEGAMINYNEENAVLKVYGEEIEISDFKKMFENDITVLDKNGNVAEDGFVKTGMTVDYGEGVKVLLMGDVDGNGKINTMDYATVKRHIIGTLRLTGDGYDAACITGSKPRATDYAAIKRHVIGTLNIVAYFK